MSANKGPNSLRGYVPVKIGGTEFFLRFSWSTMRRLTEMLDRDSVQDLLQKAKEWQLDDIICCLVAGLQSGSFKDQNVSREELEDMLELSEMQQYAEAVSEAFQSFSQGKTKKITKKGLNSKKLKQVSENEEGSTSADFTTPNTGSGGH